MQVYRRLTAPRNGSNAIGQSFDPEDQQKLKKVGVRTTAGGRQLQGFPGKLKRHFRGRKKMFALVFALSEVSEHMRLGSKHMIAIEGDVVQHGYVRSVGHECFIPIGEDPHRPRSHD